MVTPYDSIRTMHNIPILTAMADGPDYNLIDAERVELPRVLEEMKGKRIIGILANRNRASSSGFSFKIGMIRGVDGKQISWGERRDDIENIFDIVDCENPRMMNILYGGTMENMVYPNIYEFAALAGCEEERFSVLHTDAVSAYWVAHQNRLLSTTRHTLSRVISARQPLVISYQHKLD